MNSRDNEGISSPYQITVRFGNEILQAGFTAVPNLVLDHYGTLGITSAEMMFVIHVWQYWWTEKNPYPSLQAIADRMATSRRQVRRYTESLKEKGLLRVNERRQPGLGQVSSEYDFAPLIEQVLHLASKDNGARTEMTSPPRTEMTEGARTILTEAPRTEMTPEEYSGEKHTQREEGPSKFEIRKASPNDLESGRTPPRHATESRPSARRRIHGGTDSGQSEGETTGRPPRGSNGSDRPRGMVTPAEVLAERLRDVPPPPTGRRGRPPGSADEREQLRAYLADFSRELHDAAPLSSTITRVLRLFREAGVPRERWAELLYEARGITQEHSAQITTAAAGRGLKNKLPYMLAVLESRIGLRPYGEEASLGSPPAPPEGAPLAADPAPFPRGPEPSPPAHGEGYARLKAEVERIRRNPATADTPNGRRTPLLHRARDEPRERGKRSSIRVGPVPLAQPLTSGYAPRSSSFRRAVWRVGRHNDRRIGWAPRVTACHPVGRPLPTEARDGPRSPRRMSDTVTRPRMRRDRWQCRELGLSSLRWGKGVWDDSGPRGCVSPPINVNRRGGQPEHLRTRRRRRRRRRRGDRARKAQAGGRTLGAFRGAGD